MERDAARGRVVLGWILLAIGVLCTWLLEPLGQIGGFLYFQGSLSTAPVEVVEVRRMPLSEGYRRGAPVYALDYRFVADDGRTYAGVSYEAASEPGHRRNRGLVEYHATRPSISRLQGHRVTPYGPASLVVLVPGIVGMLLLTRGGGAAPTGWIGFGRG